MKSSRTDPGLLATKDRYVWVIGGRSKSGTAMRGVCRYDLAKDFWVEMPPLVKGRSAASACFFVDCIYVFFGIDTFGWTLGSIEKFEKGKNLFQNIDLDLQSRLH